MTKWLLDDGKDEDVVISTRLRLARNLKSHKFPKFMNMEESDIVTNAILDRFKDLEDKESFEFHKILDLSPTDKNIYVEKHLISPSLLETPNKSSFLVSESERTTVMINEEDHLRIQILLPGFNLKEGWKRISDIDDRLEEELDYAYHYEFGYLTACPTNVGTGLRASVMVHVPAIALGGNLNVLIEGLRRIGLTVRGIYGEGSKALGDLYQISNQITLGESEEQIMDKLKKVIYQVINRERNTREFLYTNRKIELEDKIFRSLGILKYSRKMSSIELMEHLSNVKLGVDLGLIKNLSSKDIVKLMIDLQPNTLQDTLGYSISKKERDYNRAKKVKEFLVEVEG